MKRKILLFVILILFCVLNVYAAESVKLSATGQAYTGKCILHGYIIGTDGTNNPTITIYDGTSTSGEEIIPTAEYDAAALGVNGVVLSENASIECKTGIYVSITTSGTCEVVAIYTPIPW